MSAELALLDPRMMVLARLDEAVGQCAVIRAKREADGGLQTRLRGERRRRALGVRIYTFPPTRVGGPKTKSGRRPQRGMK